MPCFFVLGTVKDFVWRQLGLCVFCASASVGALFAFWEEDMENNNYALKTKEKIEGIRKAFFHSPLFLAVCILQTVNVAVSLITILTSLGYFLLSLAIPLVPSALSWGNGVIVVLRCWWLLLLFNGVFCTLCSSISTFGGWHLYLTAKSHFSSKALKAFRVIFYCYAVKNFVFVIGAGVTSVYLAATNMMDIILPIVLMTVAIVFETVLLWIYSDMFQYVTSLVNTFGTDRDCSLKLPFVRLVVGGILTVLLQVSLLPIAVYVLLLIFF